MPSPFSSIQAERLISMKQSAITSGSTSLLKPHGSVSSFGFDKNQISGNRQLTTDKTMILIKIRIENFIFSMVYP
jgi:hypothetical protein